MLRTSQQQALAGLWRIQLHDVNIDKPFVRLTVTECVLIETSIICEHTGKLQGNSSNCSSPVILDVGTHCWV